MAKNKKSKSDYQARTDPHLRKKKFNTILLTALIGMVSAGFIAGMIYWAYHADRFR